MEIFRELDQSPRVLSCLHNLAIIQLQMGNFEPALTLMEEAYRANKALGSSTSIYSLAITHNVVHILRGQYGQALEALLPSLEMDESQIVSGIWVDIFQQLAWCYYDLGHTIPGWSTARGRSATTIKPVKPGVPLPTR